MQRSLFRIVLFFMVSIPFMGCSQNKNNAIPPKDSVEMLLVTTVYYIGMGNFTEEDSLKMVRCESYYSFETGDDNSSGLKIFYNDSVFIKFIDKKSLTKRPDLYGYLVKSTNHTLPRICTDARKVNYDRALQSFVTWSTGTNADLKNYQLVIKAADHQRKVYSFHYTLNIQTYNGVVKMVLGYFYHVFLTTKLDPAYQIEYVVDEKFIP